MAYRDSTANSGDASSTPNTTVPAGVVEGDIIILVASIDLADADFATADWPTGFTELREVTLTGDGHSLAIGWKRTTGADAGSYTFADISGGVWADWVCQAFAFSGRHTTDPPVASTSAENNAANGSPVTMTANGVTAVAGDDLVAIYGPDVRADGAGNGVAGPGGIWTEREETELGWSNLAGYTAENVSAGATGNIAATLTLSSSSSGWAAWVIRIPSAAAPGVTAEVDAALKKVTASLNAEQRQLIEIDSTLIKTAAAISAKMNYAAEIDATVAKLAAALGAIAPTETARVNATLRPLAASINLQQEQRLTVGATLIRTSGAVNAVMVPDAAIGASLAILAANLNAQSNQLVTIDSDLVKLSAALGAVMVPNVTLSPVLARLAASLNAEMAGVGPELTITAALGRITANLNAEQRYTIEVDGALIKLAGSFNAEQRQLLTIGATLANLEALLNAEQRQELTIAATLVRLTASLGAEMPAEIRLTPSLARLMASILAGPALIISTPDIDLAASYTPVSTGYAATHTPAGSLAGSYTPVIDLEATP